MIVCKLKKLRLSNDITQRELAEQVSIRYPTISEMERGASKAYSLDNLNKLCKYFHCCIGDLIEYIPDSDDNE